MLFQYFKCSAVNLGSQQLSATECFASIWDFFSVFQALLQCSLLDDCFKKHPSPYQLFAKLYFVITLIKSNENK